VVSGARPLNVIDHARQQRHARETEKSFCFFFQKEVFVLF
jgi:hypothetical protein